MSNIVKPLDLTTANHATPQYAVGQYYFDFLTRRLHRYVKVTIGGTNANTLIAGRPVYNDVFASAKCLTDDQGTDGTFAGTLQLTVTSGYWTWIIVEGDDVPVLVTNSLAKGTNLVPGSSAGTLKTQNSTLSVTENVVGKNKETGKNPATPVTTLCSIRGS